MVTSERTFELAGDVQETATLVLFPNTEPFDTSKLSSLATDFFCWLEEIWQLPVVDPSAVTWRDLDHLLSPVEMAEDGWYTIQDLCLLWGYTVNKVRMDLTKYDVRSERRLDRHGTQAGNPPKVYHGRQLTHVIAHWEWQRLHAALDACWSRFAQPRCGKCNCRQMVNVQLNCERRNSTLLRYRRSVYRFLRGMRDYGSVTTWWQHEHGAIFARVPESVAEESGLVLLYLLDRRLLSLTYDELLRLPLPDITNADLARPWRNRRPEEYACFLRGLDAANYGETTRETAVTLLVFMILVKHGLPGVAELGQKLSAEEATQALREDRLLTQHLGYGVYLPCLLTTDIRMGHVALDELRHCLWAYQAEQTRLTGRPQWQVCLRRWLPMHVRAVELALAAYVWPGEQALLIPRPETTAALPNRARIRERAEREGYSVTLLPEALQQAIQAYLTYRYQEQRISIKTLVNDLTALVHFLAWAREHMDLVAYPRWDKEQVRNVLRQYLATMNAPTNSVYFHLSRLYTFFQTLALLELPHPCGYQVIPRLLPVLNKESRQVPREELLDRVFRDGVCHLDYDPLSRLALTIQYFCGTRVTETCDLHLFSILEETEGQVYLLIPLGKSKRERPFPIVEVGMGPLLSFMDEVVKRQLRPDGRPKALPRTNPRYLDTDPEQASTWYYLFDRSTDERRGGKTQTRLSPSRVSDALHEAMLLAAKVNPEGLFREETYSLYCRHTRRRGQCCSYVALCDGVTTCPVCGGPLPGRRGHHCYWKLKEGFSCDGKAEAGDYFCPKCDAPLAEFLFVGTHAFRHNSVTRAHRHGIALEHNMRLHGHQTVPMHLKYLHLLPEDLRQEVRQVFAEKRLRDVRLATSYAPGQVIEDGVAHTATLPQYLGLTLRRALKRRTAGLWGGFWAGALASQGPRSPMSNGEDIVVTEETYVHTVAQYRYEALGLAVSEVALERGTRGKFKAHVASFLDRERVDTLVTHHLAQVQEYMRSPLGVRLMEADVKEQQEFLDQLADMLRPWWEPLGSIDQLVTALTPGGIDAFAKE